jgi:hypothetical protein
MRAPQPGRIGLPPAHVEEVTLSVCERMMSLGFPNVRTLRPGDVVFDRGMRTGNFSSCRRKATIDIVSAIEGHELKAAARCLITALV